MISALLCLCSLLAVASAGMRHPPPPPTGYGMPPPPPGYGKPLHHQTPAMDPFMMHMIMNQNNGGSSSTNNPFQQMLLLQSLQGQQMGHHGQGGYNPMLLASLLNQCTEPVTPCTPPNMGELCGVDPDPLMDPVYNMCCVCND